MPTSKIIFRTEATAEGFEGAPADVVDCGDGRYFVRLGGHVFHTEFDRMEAITACGFIAARGPKGVLR